MSSIYLPQSGNVKPRKWCMSFTGLILYFTATKRFINEFKSNLENILISSCGQNDWIRV